jgi:DNA-directed RNA polymerase specialized sigma24 family protein
MCGLRPDSRLAERRTHVWTSAGRSQVFTQGGPSAARPYAFRYLRGNTAVHTQGALDPVTAGALKRSRMRPKKGWRATGPWPAFAAHGPDAVTQLDRTHATRRSTGGRKRRVAWLQGSMATPQVRLLPPLAADATQELYARYEHEVAGFLAGTRAGSALSADERADAYHDALEILFKRKAAGTEIVDDVLFLRRVAHDLAKNRLRSRDTRKTLPADPFVMPEDPLRPALGSDAQAISNSEWRLYLGMLGALSEREQAVLTLTMAGCSPPEIAGELALKRARVDKVLSEARKRMETWRRTAEDEGCWRRNARVLAAHGARALRGEFASLVDAHVEGCTTCQVGIAIAQRQVPLALAPIPLFFARAVSRARGAARAARGLLHSLAVRLPLVGDPQAAVIAGRPGVAAGLVAACLAGGGAATYCAVQGVPGAVQSVLGASASSKPVVVHRPRRSRPVTRTIAVAPAVTPKVSAAPSPRATTVHRASHVRRRHTATQTAGATSAEFSPESSTASSSATPAQTQTQTQTTASATQTQTTAAPSSDEFSFER